MIQITIPKKTPSINHLYGQHGYRKFLKPEGRELKEYITSIVTEQVKSIEYNPEAKLKVEVDIYENWLTKKGLVARKDVANREKFLIDSVFQALGIDDKFIYKHTMNKVQSKTEKSVIKISEIEEKEIVHLDR